MISESFQVFAAAADAGSFTKAAAALFMSPTNVMKHINRLEDRLDLVLFERTARGLTLTESGQILLDAWKEMDETARNALEKARGLQDGNHKVLKIGTSILNDPKPLLDLINTVWPEQKPFQIALVPFQDNRQNILHEIEAIGSRYDVIYGICDSKTWLQSINFLELRKAEKMVAVPVGHPLASYRSLHLADLNHCKLMMVANGDSGTNDQIRSFLQQKLPDLQLVDGSRFYDLDTFNTALQKQILLLTTDLWKNVHPGFVTLPVVDWNFSIPCGLLYGRQPSSPVKTLLSGIKKFSAL